MIRTIRITTNSFAALLLVHNTVARATPCSEQGVPPLHHYLLQVSVTSSNPFVLLPIGLLLVVLIRTASPAPSKLYFKQSNEKFS